MKKRVLISINSLCNKDGKFNNEIERVILKLDSLYYDVAIYYYNDESLNFISNSLFNYCIKVNKVRVRNGSLVIHQFSKTISAKDFIILGASESDFFLANRSNVLFLASFWSTMHEKVEKYGLRIKSPLILGYFLTTIASIKQPWYYKVQIDTNTVLYSLMSSNTKYSKDLQLIKICNSFNAILKNGDTDFLQLIKFYFIHTLSLIENIRDIDVWTYYPSSTSSYSEVLSSFSELSRHMFSNKREKYPVFIRFKPSQKRHHLTPSVRKSLGCDSQFDSIYLNTKLKDNLKNAKVCVIDDYTTYGSSCETTRHLLNSAGVNKLIFITFGKFGFDSSYTKTSYTLKGDIFSSNYSYIRHADTTIYGNTVENANDIKKALKVMI